MPSEADSRVDAYPRVIRFPLETPRLVIRPMTLDDATDLHEVYSDAETMQFLTAEIPRTHDETRAWMVPKIEQQLRDGISLWSAVLRSNGKVVGDCGLQWADDERSVMELGFRLNRAFWSRGLGREAASACIAAGVEQLGQRRLVSGTDVGNVRARRLLERLGMRYLREIDWFGRTMAEYELHARDWADADHGA